jgi:type I restriction-modification system DNA methylase subunit
MPAVSDALFDHYRHTLEDLGKQPGTLALVFGKAQNKFQDPAKLRRVIVDLIDAEDWSAMGADVKGDAYEGLLERNAQDIKSGAGQYFTPRALIQAMVDCIAPRPGEVIVRRREGPLDLLETPAHPAPAAPAAFCSPHTSTSHTTTPTSPATRSAT